MSRDYQNSNPGVEGRSVISAKAACRVFGSGTAAVTAVNGIDLEVKPGEFLALTGRSGSGKTTLLNTLLGLVSPWRGQVLIMGQPARSLRKKVWGLPAQAEAEAEDQANQEEAIYIYDLGFKNTQRIVPISNHINKLGMQVIY